MYSKGGKKQNDTAFARAAREDALAASGHLPIYADVSFPGGER